MELLERGVDTDPTVTRHNHNPRRARPFDRAEAASAVSLRASTRLTDGPAMIGRVHDRARARAVPTGVSRVALV
jgi:hypothetical protein